MPIHSQQENRESRLRRQQRNKLKKSKLKRKKYKPTQQQDIHLMIGHNQQNCNSNLAMFHTLLAINPYPWSIVSKQKLKQYLALQKWKNMFLMYLITIYLMFFLRIIIPHHVRPKNNDHVQISNSRFIFILNLRKPNFLNFYIFVNYYLKMIMYLKLITF